MRRREFVSAAAAAGAAGVTGCIDGGEGDDDNDTDDRDGDDASPTVTDTSFSSSVLRDGGAEESASYSFEDEKLHVTGVIVGSDACKTAELESAEYDGDRGAIVFDVVTVDAEDAGEVCAEVLKPIAYEAVVEIDLMYQVQPAVVVTHDGEEVEATEGAGEVGGADGPSLTGSELEVTNSECGTGAEETGYTATQATSEDDESLGIVEGTLSGPDGCTTAELGYTSYDTEDDVLVVDVRTARTDDEACQDCITEVDYRVEATFEGGVAESAEVSHDGVRVDGVGDGIADAGFSVEGVENASGGDGTGDAEFQEDEGRVVVSGTIVGDDGCATARLAGASLDDGTLRVDVETVGKNPHSRLCTEALVAIRYEATFSFDGEIPDEISLSHDGTGVMSGAYASESVEAGNGSES